ncbi:Retinoblastoma-like protein 2, partial [Clarias magur]
QQVEPEGQSWLTTATARQRRRERSRCVTGKPRRDRGSRSRRRPFLKKHLLDCKTLRECIESVNTRQRTHSNSLSEASRSSSHHLALYEEPPEVKCHHATP